MILLYICTQENNNKNSDLPILCKHYLTPMGFPRFQVYKKEAPHQKFIFTSRMYIFSKAIWESLFQKFPDKEMKLICYLVLIRST